MNKELSTLSPHVATILPQGLIDELRSMIDQTRESVAVTVNAKLTMLYWHIGNRVCKEILNDERAEYGQEIVSTVSRQLMSHYGRGFSDKNLRRMIHFGEVFLSFVCNCPTSCGTIRDSAQFLLGYSLGA